MIPRGTSVVSVIAQIPGGHSGNLSTLIPLAYLDGEPADAEDFPNNGLIFWYMRPKEVAAALPPGTIVISSVENANPSSTVPLQDRHQYRAEENSVREPSPTEVLQILDYYNVLTHPRELLLIDDLVLPYRPLPQVFVRTSEAVYGPFATASKPLDVASNKYTVSLKPTGERVGVVPIQEFESLASSGQVISADAVVSLKAQPPKRSPSTFHCSFQLACPDGIEALYKSIQESVVVRTPEQILRQLTRKYIDQRRFQQAQALFEEFVNTLGTEREGLTLTQLEVIEAIQYSLERDKRGVRELTDTILDSGLLKASIDDRIRARIEQHIAESTAEITSQIRERTREVQLHLEALEKQRTALQAEIDASSREASQRIDVERFAFMEECEQKRSQLRAEQEELDSKRNELTQYLQDVTNRYSSSKDRVINDFISLIPLLERINILTPRPGAESSDTASSSHREFAFPTYVTTTSDKFEPVMEEVFFERFLAHVEASGFRYRRIDLVSFHLNFKNCEFFVLGGVSGTGKSSLPQLYTEALAGDSFDGRQRLLRIAVNPTWLEVNDLLGRVNVLDRTFNPAETGLFRHLVFADAEYENKKLDSAMWPVVLDEMNLAHPEHYFGPFLQVFGLDHSRSVAVFDPAVVDRRDPFIQWSKLRLPHSLRFIGTVNFDETTKALSLRLLDRGPVSRIDIAPDSGAVLPKKASGPSVLLRHFEDWAVRNEIPRSASILLDAMNPYLKKLGCPFNPRRRRAIEAYLSNLNPAICSPEEAFDLAISQRVLPLVRGLFRQSSRDAFDGLKKAILDSNLAVPECERILEEIEERESSLLLTT